MSSKNNRKLTYALAINEALRQMMKKDKTVFLMGQGVKSPWYVGKTCLDLMGEFGEGRVIDTPVSENAMTGAAVGASIAGMRAVVVHPRMDFMLYAFDPIINQAANWRYMCGGRSSVPVVIWGIINRGGEQAAQHSQALHALFAHVPGLKVVMPSTPYDAKGLMISAIKDNDPVVYIDDRWLYNVEGNVSEEIYEVPIGKAVIRRDGSDVTLVSVSYMMQEVIKATDILADDGIKAEVIDLRTIKPVDVDTLVKSAKKTGSMVVVDGGWRSFGLSAEVSALVSENAFDFLKSGIKRITIPECPAPSSGTMEKEYYRITEKIVSAAREAVKGRKQYMEAESYES